jgi:hypothetical protein
MQLSFTVHNPHRVPFAQNVEHKGKTVRAALDAFEVELKSNDGVSGTLKLRITGVDEVAEAEKMFVADAVVTFSVASDAPVAAEVPAAPAALEAAA